MKIKIGCKEYALSDAVAATGGYAVGADRPIHSVCTDSREAGPGVLFVALGGERVDGHTFIPAVLESGCAAVLCERFPRVSEELDVSAVVVPNTERALANLASAYLKTLSPVRVAVTGSVGKTTTKEFLCAVLSRCFNTYKTEANYNSLIGMPMSVLGLTPEHGAAVFEMGMSARGEIETLSRVLCPDIALITNIGSSHLEYLKTRENIALAKWEIVSGLREGGLLILNGDEPLLRGRVCPGRRVRTVCVHTEGDYTVTEICQRPELWRTEFSLRTPDGRVLTDLRIPTIGTHMVYDAAYAVTVGLELGMSEEDIREGLMDYRSEALRQNLINIGEISVLADCYNAAPESMSQSLHVLVSYAASRDGRALAVLGDMRELGEGTKALHEAVGAEVATLGVAHLVTLGELGVSIAEGALGAGMGDAEIDMIRQTDDADLDAAARRLWQVLRPGDVVLLKASRSLAAERMVEALRRHAPKR